MTVAPSAVEFGGLGRVADPGMATGNEARNPQCLVVAGKDHIKRVVDLAEAEQLRFEHVEIEVRRRQKDHAELGLVVDAAAGQFQLPKRLDRHPISH